MALVKPAQGDLASPRLGDCFTSRPVAATWSRGRPAVIAIVDTAAMPNSQERAIAHVTSLAASEPDLRRGL